mmetsp:Transcript_135316/g.234605  ORF Transcript_135316/g.234605 Transcript_135316/m.234605 type:complete len:324 (+) Transcript_135316:103-1074(+)
MREIEREGESVHMHEKREGERGRERKPSEDDFSVGLLDAHFRAAGQADTQSPSGVRITLQQPLWSLHRGLATRGMCSPWAMPDRTIVCSPPGRVLGRMCMRQAGNTTASRRQVSRSCHSAVWEGLDRPTAMAPRPDTNDAFQDSPTMSPKPLMSLISTASTSSEVESRSASQSRQMISVNAMMEHTTACMTLPGGPSMTSIKEDMRNSSHLTAKSRHRAKTMQQVIWRHMRARTAYSRPRTAVWSRMNSTRQPTDARAARNRRNVCTPVAAWRPRPACVGSSPVMAKRTACVARKERVRPVVMFSASSVSRSHRSSKLSLTPS